MKRVEVYSVTIANAVKKSVYSESEDSIQNKLAAQPIRLRRRSLAQMIHNKLAATIESHARL